MTESQKKIRHLSTTMIQWAEENKIRIKNGKFEIPSRPNVRGMAAQEWKEDFKFVQKLDGYVSEDAGLSLTPNEMKMCNNLYSYYRSVYDTI